MIKYFLLIFIFISCKETPATETVVVRGSSMAPCFNHGDKLKVKDFDSKHKLQHGDFIVFNYKNKSLLKKVVALPNDKFEIISNNGCHRLMVNSTEQKNSERKEYCFSSSMLKVFADSYKNIVPKDHFIALGDQVQGSEDSSLYGLLQIESISKVVKQAQCTN